MTAAAIAPLVVIVLVLVVGTMLARRRGYAVGGDTIVRCREGHLFTTIWIPGGSLKAIRFGWLRFQRCPVGDHLTFVMPVREADLTDQERAFARAHHDAMVP